MLLVTMQYTDYLAVDIYALKYIALKKRSETVGCINDFSCMHDKENEGTLLMNVIKQRIE